VATKHTVEPGDWIGAIADQYGFDHWSQIWDHEVNEAIRALRRTPDLLMVGDEVNIPGPEDRPGIEVASGQRVVFVARAREDVLRLRVDGLTAFLLAIGPVEFELEVGSNKVTGEIEKEGQILEVPLDPKAKEAVLTLGGEKKLHYAIGGLGPADETHGARSRLRNLLYDGDDDEVTFKTYQRLRGLEPTGELDEPTRLEILAQYGD
jgi:hypothetical protein